MCSTSHCSSCLLVQLAPSLLIGLQGILDISLIQKMNTDLFVMQLCV